ncbi:MAG: FixH family protein [Gammaproteobacteria bacterium]|nr:FixH family protein [Gammaproteobacteria bacterium]
MNAPQREDTQPWYKQFWPWFIIALPGSVVIAGFVTLWISMQNSHEMVTGDYFKKGLAINETKERQKEAERRNLSFEVALTNKRIEINAPDNFNEPLLYLFFQHPAKSAQDFTLVLNRNQQGIYFADAREIEDFDYRIRLWSPENTWELKSRWQPTRQSAFVLKAQ